MLESSHREVILRAIAGAVFVITKPFALSLSKCECGSTSSPRTVSFYCALAIYNTFTIIPLPSVALDSGIHARMTGLKIVISSKKLSNFYTVALCNNSTKASAVIAGL